MTNNQYQSTGPLSTATHRCRNNEFFVLPFHDEILSNLFVYVNILAITIQQVSNNKTLLVWSIWPNLFQTLHKTPCYGPGSQLWRANGRGLYLALTTKFPTWCVEGVSVGRASWRKSVVCHRGGLPQGVNHWNKVNIIWIMVLMYNKIISHTISATQDTWDVWMYPKPFDNRSINHWIFFQSDFEEVVKR